MHAITVLVFIILSGVPIVRAQTADAIVVYVKGRASMRDGKDARPRPLHKNDKLFSDQQVRCDRGCAGLTISYCNVPLPVANGPEWTTVLSMNCRPPEVPRGGGKKGAATTIVSPREGETIRPKTFSLKMAVDSPSFKLRLTLKIYLGREIWSQDVDERTLASASANIVQKIQEAQQVGNLHLILVSDDGYTRPPDTVKFKLISLRDQKNLDKKLESAELVTDEVSKHLGRGMAFSEFEIYDEGVAELERALRLSEERSADKRTVAGLLRLLILTNYQAYNDERVSELCSTFKKKRTAVPSLCSQY